MTGIRALVVVALCAAPVAADIIAERAKEAKKLFEQGRTMLSAGDITGACAKFEASLKLDPALGTRLNLAECRRRQSRWLDAYTLFEASAVEAARLGDKTREKFARDQLVALYDKLARITLVVAEPATPELVVKLEGRALSPDEWALQHVLEPGKIVIEATGRGRKPHRIEHAAPAGSEAMLEIPALEPVELVIAPIAAAPQDAPPANRSKLPWIIGGAGVGLVTTSIVLGFHAKSRYDDAVASGDRDAVDSAQLEADIGTVVAVVGLAAVATGVVLYVRGRRDSVVVAPTASTSAVGAFVHARF